MRLSPPAMGKTMVAVCQMRSTADKAENLASVTRLVSAAAAASARLVFLPECLDYVGHSRLSSVQMAESLTMEGGLMSSYKALAAKHGVWLSLGGFHVKEDPKAEKAQLTHLLLDDQGLLVASYAKSHLFEVNIPGGTQLREADFSDAGRRWEPPVETPAGRLGLGVCYDLRFPLMSQWLRAEGAELLSFPSAFTEETGRAHWELLLRAKATETQCYVAAAAQSGAHNDKRSSWGHAMIVDPWGKVLAEVSQPGEGLVTAEVDSDYLAQVRRQLNLQGNARSDLGHLASQLSSRPEVPKEETLDFGGHPIPRDHVFLTSRLSFAFVNRKPVLPGHALISPRRRVAKLTELTPEETSDLFLCAQKVQRMLERKYQTTSTTLNVQDGELAGQSVYHVHVHLLPRHEGDFKNNDDIYVTLSSHDKGPQDPKSFRSHDVMAQEAGEFRQLLKGMGL